MCYLSVVLYLLHYKQQPTVRNQISFMLLTVNVLSVCCTLLTLVYHRHHTHTFYWCSPWKDWCTCRQVRHRQACPTSSHGGYVSCWKPQICYEMYRQICTVTECHSNDKTNMHQNEKKQEKSKSWQVVSLPHCKHWCALTWMLWQLFEAVEN